MRLFFAIDPAATLVVSIEEKWNETHDKISSK